ncbi:Bug family tripartite tricarboxylate transporter substrate binding protein [Cupriavidus agavae]|uniref:Tripartite-type tricarboxylate transporter receptor subunit TctC n=1 Tax=Cupriavidus agavae TaxID=1001822 RepID=A0A4Q7R7R7_9BURK|nr:tripartite tricarboxylate transporter substrate binding protein [Cupriavidus agavae]RZT28853.1 tripartite-type tricarboxylate transporter receptor subunit TctC [Cupriavidus agavae]
MSESNFAADRRRFIAGGGSVLGLGALSAFGLPPRALAAQWPERTVRFVTYSGAGDPVDLRLRDFLQSLAREYHNTPMIVENKTGAAGQIAAQSVLLAPPEGYDFLLANATFTITPTYFRKLQYKPLSDFVPVALSGSAPIGFAVPASNPARTFKEWVAWAKQQRGSLNYASLGNGSVSHLYGFQIRDDFKLDATHIPYKASGAALIDVLRGQISYVMLDTFNLRPLLAKKQLRILAVTGADRSQYLPDVPTFRELGFNGYERTGWTAYMAKAGTSRDIVASLNKSINKVNAMPEWARKRDEVWSVWKPLTPDELHKQLQGEVAAWGDLVRRSGVFGD